MLLCIHHAASIICASTGLLIGYGAPGLMNFGMLMELSTIFLNYRSMLSKQEHNEFWPKVNGIMIFILWTIFRTIGIPYYTYMLIINCILTWDHVTIFQKVCMCTGIPLFILIGILNMFWYWKIFKFVLKALGCIKVDNSNKYEKVEKTDDET